MKLKRLLLPLCILVFGSPAFSVEPDKGQPLVEPLTENEWSEEQKQLFSLLTSNNADGKRPLNILGTIAHHPELLRVFLPWASQLGATTTLPPRELEILALRTAWRAESDYEWGHHFDFGLAAGLSKVQMDSLARENPKADWSEADRLLIQAADELIAGVKLQPTTVEKLLATYSKKEVVEIIWIVNQYNSLSKFANSLGVQLEDVYFQ